MQLKKIAAITMARNDEWFLNRWIAYYGKIFGEKNLFIYLDGEDQKKPSGAGMANVAAVPKLGIEVRDAEKRRLNFLSDRAAELLKKYDIVIGVDADEFLALDPKVGMGLPEYLSEKKIGASLSPLGLDFAQHLAMEKAFDDGKPFLAQRRHALIHSRFTKASIITKPVRWGRGFHRIRGRNFHIDPNLYLLHFGNYNYDAVIRKMNHPDIIARNEVKHYKRNRLRIFNVVSGAKARSFDRTVRLARIIQTIFRNPLALNKPAMLGLNWVVKIPERFKGLA
jgi:hypothetical protein